MKLTLYSAFARLSTILIVSLMLLPSASAKQADPLVILFGDSITAGVYIPSGVKGFGCAPGDSACSVCVEGEYCNGIANGTTDFALPDIELTAILKKSRRPSTVVNWGYGSTTSGPSEFFGNDGLGRIKASLLASQNQFPTAQNIVLIMYGTNDASQGIPSDATGLHVGFMIDKSFEVGVTPVVATIPPRTGEDVNPRNYFIKQQSAGKATVVDIYTIIIAAANAAGHNLLYDGIHPNPEGYAVIAQAWFDHFLEAAIEQQAPTIAPIVSFLLDED